MATVYISNISGSYRNLSIQTESVIYPIGCEGISLTSSNHIRLAETKAIKNARFAFSANSPLLVTIKENIVTGEIEDEALLSLTTVLRDTDALKRNSPDWQKKYFTFLHFHKSYRVNRAIVPFVFYNRAKRQYTNISCQENIPGYLKFDKNCSRENTVFAEITGQFRFIRPSNIKAMSFGNSDTLRSALCQEQMASYKAISNGEYFPIIADNLEFYDAVQKVTKKIKSSTNRRIR